MKILAAIIACIVMFVLVRSEIDSSQPAFYFLNILLLGLTGYIVFAKDNN